MNTETVCAMLTQDEAAAAWHLICGWRIKCMRLGRDEDATIALRIMEALEEGGLDDADPTESSQR